MGCFSDGSRLARAMQKPLDLFESGNRKARRGMIIRYSLGKLALHISRSKHGIESFTPALLHALHRRERHLALLYFYYHVSPSQSQILTEGLKTRARVVHLCN